MLSELLLLRRGKADWNTGSDDFRRPLAPKGKRAAQRIGVLLQQQGLIPDLVVSSPALRALAMAREVCKVVGRPVAQVVQDDRLYDAGLASLLRVLEERSEGASRLMLVGHNPGLEDLLLHLTEGTVTLPEDGKLLRPATLAHLQFRKSGARPTAGSARLVALNRAQDLPTRFPFPTSAGVEFRSRPAYYYRQCSVIPYRVQDGEMQVLVISSRNRRRWIVPKGIHEPGLSAPEAAAVEAWEEAGVEGEVGPHPLGSYSYRKWGANCTVEVYPMEVTRVLPESEWKERQRGRAWVSAVQASTRLAQPELRPMVLALATVLLEFH
jgi:phosphohistidine phosphatase